MSTIHELLRQRAELDAKIADLRRQEGARQLEHHRAVLANMERRHQEAEERARWANGPPPNEAARRELERLKKAKGGG